MLLATTIRCGEFSYMDVLLLANSSSLTAAKDLDWTLNASLALPTFEVLH